MTKVLSMRHVSMAVLVCSLLAGCAQLQNLQSVSGGEAEDANSMQLVKTSYDALPGWTNDNPVTALAALQQSCAVIKKRDPAKELQANHVGGTASDWQPACRALDQFAATASAQNANEARHFIEQWFAPYAITTPNGSDGLFTGYYEASLRGSLTPQGPYHVPLYQRPPDLVTAELGTFRPSLQGERIAGRVASGALQPYSDRAAIQNGALKNKNLELLWVDNAIDAFFLQIQGSGRVVLPDTRVLRVGYDGQNGYPYTAIGGELIKRGELTKDNVSMQTIRQWLQAHPDQATSVMGVNKSYVFFKVLDQDQPLGASGVGLTPERSIAVDPRFIPYGAPVWIATQHPLQPNQPVQRLFIAQDTGGAIRGPVRADIFWGYGPMAEQAAGNMKARGQAWLLLPKQTHSALSVTVPASP